MDNEGNFGCDPSQNTGAMDLVQLDSQQHETMFMINGEEDNFEGKSILKTANLHELSDKEGDDRVEISIQDLQSKSSEFRQPNKLLSYLVNVKQFEPIQEQSVVAEQSVVQRNDYYLNNIMEDEYYSESGGPLTDPEKSN